MKGKPGSTKGAKGSSHAALPTFHAVATASTAPQRAPASVRLIVRFTNRSATDPRHGLRRAPRLPSLPILARQPPVGFRHVGHLHLRTVIQDLLRLAGA